jgi:hypothetical protein
MAMTLITTNTSSNAASSSFTSSIDSTYKLYIFKFIDLNPATDGTNLQFQGNVAGQSGFNETMTTSSFRTYAMEDDSDAALEYADYDQAQGTGYQYLTSNTGSDSDQSSAGYLYLFNPSNTTYVKHFYARCLASSSSNGTFTHFTAGYFNVTGAIDEVDFKMEAGNFDGTIKMYGVG